MIIGSKKIGTGHPCFIIAEAGCNNNGSLELAKKLVDAAKNAGADAVKFQTFLTEKLVTKTTPKAEYQKKGKKDKESYFDLLKNIEISKKEWCELKDYCDNKGILFMSTPHSGEWSIKLLEELGIPAYKIGSGDLTNLPFLESIGKLKKPIFLSTGMANLDEINEAIDTIKKSGNDKIILLHATTSYPCDFNDVNLSAMITIRNKFGYLTGYSDHTLGIEVPTAAIALGAHVIEKHFTLDKKMQGPDHKASLEPNEFKDMVKSIRNIEEAMGSFEKKPTKTEVKIMKVIRKSIVAEKDISKGQIITKDDLIIKRPGTGIKPSFFYRIIGKKATRTIKKDELLKEDDFQ